MSGVTTKRMLAAYIQTAAPTMFFSGFFQSPARNFHSSEEVEIDIVRSDEEVSIVIQDLSTGHRMNSADLYTNKGFKPPIHKEAMPLNAFDLMKRAPGQNPFESPDFRANLIMKMFDGMLLTERKIRRAMELQASQVMQEGKITLRDANGVALYELDYKPKATHFPTAGTAWGSVGADPLGDIEAMTEVNRNDGLSDSDEIIMGIDAWGAFIKDASVQAVFDNRRVDLGTISPMQKRGDGGMYRGTVEVGNYKLDVWTYGGRYKDPQTGVSTQFMAPEKVIVRDSTARMDASFGAIPNISSLLGGGARLLPELPNRLSNDAGGMDLHTNVWMSADGEQIFGGVGARPLMIPTAIDTYSCLDTGL